MIPLFVENGVANVWNAEDWFMLRTKFRICGALIGSLPSFPRQNDFMGLPVALMAEEAALLVDRGICELYELPNIANKPTEIEKQHAKSLEEKLFREHIRIIMYIIRVRSLDGVVITDLDQRKLFNNPHNSIALEELERLRSTLRRSQSDDDKIEESSILCQQTEALKKRRVEQLSQKIDIIVAGKRQKLLSKGVSDEHINKKTLLQEEINKLPPLAPAHALLHLPTRHYIDTEKRKVGTEVLSPSVIKGDRDLHFTIFNDLWEKGHYITSGSKFGSDYLLYPGDPVKFHAMYMVWCVKDRKTSFQPIKLIAFGRLSVAVNKIALMAFSDDLGKVQYQTLKWHDNMS